MEKPKMIRNRKKFLYKKLVILIICFFIVLRIFSLVLSKYQDEAWSVAEVDVAFYLLKEDLQSMTINLDSLFPQENAYIYTFSIGNTDGTNTAEVDLTYDLKLKTTTNLPLKYKLYMNENYTDKNAKDIIIKDEIIQDDDGTYFKEISTDTQTLEYTKNTTNVYQLVVEFPENYDDESYQDIIEAIEISIEGKQLI